MWDISLHLLDILHNSIAAQAKKITLCILIDSENLQIVTVVKDDGVGIDESLLAKVTDPFYTTRTTRSIGLGVPLYKAAADLTSGSLSVKSTKGMGTAVTAWFSINSIDRPPLGSIQESLICAIMSYPNIDLELWLISDEKDFHINTKEIKARLGDVPINNFEVLCWIRDYVEKGVNQVFGGDLDEINY